MSDACTRARMGYPEALLLFLPFFGLFLAWFAIPDIVHGQSLASAGPSHGPAWVHMPWAIQAVTPLSTLTPSRNFTEPSRGSVSTTVGHSAYLSETLTHEAANARRLIELGQTTEAIRALHNLELQLPRIADRFQIVRGSLLMSESRLDEACDAFKSATSSFDSSIAARARVLEVQCHLKALHPKASTMLASLKQKYRQLPEEAMLRYELGWVKERRGDIGGAVKEYIEVDISEPGSLWGSQARQALDRLRQQNVRVRALTTDEEIKRIDGLIFWNRLDEASRNIESMQQRSYNNSVRSRLYQLADRIRKLSPASPPAVPSNTAPAIAASDAAEKEQRIQRIRRTSIKRLTLLKTQLLLRDATALGLQDVTDQIIDSLATKKLTAKLRLELAAQATGLASEDKLYSFLTPLIHDLKHQGAGYYHLARALERMGQTAEALNHFRQALATDVSPTRFYGLLAQEKIAELSNTPSSQITHIASEYVSTQPHDTANDTSHFLDILNKLMVEYNDAFPWIGRAFDLIRIGDNDAASDELYEAYLAWRNARGRKPMRAGLEAIYCGKACGSKQADRKMRKARQALDNGAQSSLARLAASLGDIGTAVLFDGRTFLMGTPRPYQTFVSTAAQERQLEPELLFAVMRTESHYQKRIISYAGAIGLMQIMPRTGRLIAMNMGEPGFSPARLLEPKTNIRMAAWYLSSLIRRFDGNVALAIAAYNGGPHNVRKWIDSVHPNMPLDAFVELIPFGQTHRYVRRVLTAYAAYAASAGKPVPALAWNLPKAKRDAVNF